MNESVGSSVVTIPGVSAIFSDVIGENVRRGLPDSYLVRGPWDSIRHLRDVHGGSEAAMTSIVREGWLDRALRAGEESASEKVAF